jgi:glycerol dehydrogenase-like iron-containing ADH family enzyme
MSGNEIVIALCTVLLSFLSSSLHSGTLVHLHLEERVEEARKVATMFAKLGLPVEWNQLGLSLEADKASMQEALDTAVEDWLVKVRMSRVEWVSGCE